MDVHHLKVASRSRARALSREREREKKRDRQTDRQTEKEKKKKNVDKRSFHVSLSPSAVGYVSLLGPGCMVIGLNPTVQCGPQPVLYHAEICTGVSLTFLACLDVFEGDCVNFK